MSKGIKFPVKIKRKKNTADRSPEPAPFMLGLLELNSRLRRNIGRRNIAVRLPKELNNLLWITNNFPNDPEMLDVVYPIQGPFAMGSLEEQLRSPKVMTPYTTFLGDITRNVFVIEATIDQLGFMYDQRSPNNHDIIWWFYSEEPNPDKKQTLVNDFHNHMRYDESVFPAIIIDKWEGLPSFVNHYIKL
jgi:hypothetical protein